MKKKEASHDDSPSGGADSSDESLKLEELEQRIAALEVALAQLVSKNCLL